MRPVLGLLVAVGCSDAPRVKEHPDNALAAIVRWKTGAPSTSEVRFGHAGQRWAIRDEALVESHEVVVYGLRPDTDYEFELVSTTANGRTTTDTLPWTSGTPPELVAVYPVDAPEPERLQPGWTLLNWMAPDHEGVVALYDLEGYPVWYREMKGSGGVIDASWTDRDAVLLGGTIPTGDKPEEVTLQGEVLWTGDRQRGDQRNGVVHHHTQRLPGGDLLTVEADIRSGVRGDRVARRTADGELLWEWSVFDAFEPVDRWDWTHANWADTDGTSVWVSLAGVSRVVKIDVATRQVVWILGREGTLQLVGDNRWFGFQHAPVRLPDGNLIVYDNQGLPDRTRVVEYAIDEAAGTATLVWQYDGGEDNPWAADFMGSVEPLANGNLLIGAGGDPDDRRCFEIDGDDRLLWTLHGTKHYRCRRIPVPLETVDAE